MKYTVIVIYIVVAYAFNKGAYCRNIKNYLKNLYIYIYSY